MLVLVRHVCRRGVLICVSEAVQSPCLHAHTGYFQQLLRCGAAGYQGCLALVVLHTWGALVKTAVFVFGSLFGLWFWAPRSLCRLSQGLVRLFQLATLRNRICALRLCYCRGGWELREQAVAASNIFFVGCPGVSCFGSTHFFLLHSFFYSRLLSQVCIC